MTDHTATDHAMAARTRRAAFYATLADTVGASSPEALLFSGHDECDPFSRELEARAVAARARLTAFFGEYGRARNMIGGA